MKMRLILLLIFTVTLHLSWCALSYAELSSLLEWDYGQYQADEGGVRRTDVSHFAQRYALLFSHKGTFMGGRGGHYDLALGGEWWGLNNNADINGISNETKINDGKLLYRGELTFAPGGLPFRLHVFSRDLTPSYFDRNSYFGRGTFDELLLSSRRQNILNPSIIVDVTDGTHHTFGASMVLGIKNGSYMGRYRNVLSHLPKLYVDYRESHVKDLTTRTPQDYRELELSFVSLNKSHNWFHYRVYEFDDFLNSANSFGEKTYLLGTIDQNLRREWIDLTNWIQLSTDGRYSEWDNRYRNQEVENDYALNLFIKTERQSWQSSLLATYSRYERFQRLERRLFVPFYASGDAGRDNTWRFRLIGARKLFNIPFAVVNTEDVEDSVYTSLRWETGRMSRYVSSPVLEMEGKLGDWGQGGAVRATYEYYSNKNLAKVNSYDLFSRLSVAYFRGTPRLGITLNTFPDVNLLEMTGRFDLAKQLNSRFRTGFGSSLLLGKGEAEVGVTDYIRPLSLERLKASRNATTRAVIDGTVWRIEALWFMEHVSLSRITNRLETGLEYQDFQSDSIGQYYLEHRLRYSTRNLNVDIRNELLYGDSLHRGVTSRVFNTALTQLEFDGTSLSHESHISYSSNREHRLTGRATLDWRLPESGYDGNRVALTQEYVYTHYLQRGAVRRLLELSQFLDYDRMDPDSSQVFEALALTGLVNYFPTSWSRLGCKVKWQNDFWLGTSDTGFGLYTDLNFSLLSVSLEYEYGIRTADSASTILDRDEQRWGVSIRKVF